MAVPCKVVEVKEGCRAEIEAPGGTQEVSLLLTPEVEVGDYVLVYAGAVVARVDEAEATEILRLYREMAELESILQ